MKYHDFPRGRRSLVQYLRRLIRGAPAPSGQPTFRFEAETAERHATQPAPLPRSTQNRSDSNNDPGAGRNAAPDERRRGLSLFDPGPEGYFRTDGEGVIQEADQGTAELLNTSAGLLVGQPVIEFVAPNLREDLGHQIARLTTGELDQVQDLETMIQPRGNAHVRTTIIVGSFHEVKNRLNQRPQPKGEAFAVLVNVRPIRDKAGRLMGFRWRMQKSAPRRPAAETSNANEPPHPALFDQMPEALLIADNDRNCVALNPAACALLGVAREQMIGRPIDNICEPDWRAALEESWRTLLAQGRHKGEWRLSLPNGMRRNFEFRAKADFLPGRHLLSGRDVTERKQNEETFRQARGASETHVRELTVELERATDGMQRATAERQRMEAAWQQAQAEWQLRMKKHAGELRDAADQLQKEIAERKRVEEAFEQARAQWEQRTREATDAITKANADWRQELEERNQVERALRQANAELEVRVKLQVDELAKINEKSSADANECQRIAEVLRSREARLRRLIDSSNIGILVTNQNGSIVEANDAFLKIAGYAREEYLSQGLRWDNITPPEFRQLDELAADAAITSRPTPPWEKEIIGKNGRRRSVSVGLASLEVASGDCIWFVLDITDRKRAEQARRRAQARWNTRRKRQTAELIKCNEQLRLKIAERDRSENQAVELRQRGNRTEAQARFALAQCLARLTIQSKLLGKKLAGNSPVAADEAARIARLLNQARHQNRKLTEHGSSRTRRQCASVPIVAFFA